MDWKSIVSAVAPMLGTALLGPFGGMAAKAISGALLGKEDASQSEIARAVANATPEQLAALKKVDADFEARMKELDVDLERVNADDRASARQRETATGDYTPKVLAVVVTVGFFALLGSMMFLDVPIQNRQILNIMIGVLGGAWMSVVTYYFGSSAGSKQKNTMLAAPSAPANKW